MGSHREPWPPLYRNKSNHIYIKLFVSTLLVGISFRLLFSHSAPFFSISNPPITAEGAVASEVGAGDEKTREEMAVTAGAANPQTASDDEEVFQEEQCDLFAGEWIPNPSGPAYTNVSCRFIEDHQNCLLNGKPETGYLYWKWKPYGCDVPPFDATKFLDAMRNKSWALIGDSILRNHAQSLICLLSKAEEAVEVFHDSNFKSRVWHFPSHNFTVSLIWTPFLIKSETFENENGESKSEIQLHLDKLDPKWTNQYESFDYVVTSGGQWFLKTAIVWQNGTVSGCHYCPGKNLPELGVEYIYRNALRGVFAFITSSAHKPRVIFRTWTPDHFEGGEWFNGGKCDRTVPFKEGEFKGRSMDHLMRRVELEEFERAESAGRGVPLKLMDTYHLSLLRPDGHAGPYRNFRPFDRGDNVKVQNDCLHWCVPGPIDAWNDLMMEMVMNE